MQTLSVNGYDMAYLDVGQRYRQQPAAGLRAWHAGRFPHLERRCWGRCRESIA